MPYVTVPNLLQEAQLLNGTQLDNNFAAFTTLVNTTKLDKDNFRPSAGIGNDRKVAGYALVPMSGCVDKITQAPSKDIQYRGLLTIPHRSQYGAGSPNTDGTYEHRTRFRGAGGLDAFDCLRVEATWSRVTGAGGGDNIYIYTTNRRGPRIDSVDSSLIMVNPNTLYSPLGALTRLSYLEVWLRWVTDATAGNRVLFNVLLTAWLKMPHVG